MQLVHNIPGGVEGEEQDESALHSAVCASSALCILLAENLREKFGRFLNCSGNSDALCVPWGNEICPGALTGLDSLCGEVRDYFYFEYPKENSLEVFVS